MKRRLKLPESVLQKIERLPPDAQQEIGRVLEHIEAGNPIHLIPFSEDQVSELVRAELAPYRPQLDDEEGELCSCDAGGYRFFVLDTPVVAYLMAMEPLPDLLPRA